MDAAAAREHVAVPEIAVNEPRLCPAGKPALEPRREALDARHRRERQPAGAQRLARHVENPAITEELEPGVGFAVRLAKAADRGVALEAEARAAMAMERGDDLREMALGVRPVEARTRVDPFEHEEILLGVKNLRNRRRRSPREPPQHPGFEVESASALHDYVPSVGETHAPDRRDGAAAERVGRSHRTAERARDTHPRQAHPSRRRSSARSPSQARSMRSSARSKSSGPP